MILSSKFVRVLLGNISYFWSNSIPAAVGILKISGSTGTVLTGNEFFATLVTTVDPAPTRSFTPMPSR
jgi:hypothetical protein